MGNKAPDVLRTPPSPMVALTLAEMHVAGWELKARCNRCAAHLRVSLPALIKAHGPDQVWWGRKGKCPGFECEQGVLTYSARSIRGGTWVAMTQTPSDRDIQVWKNKRSRYRGAR